jgi:hypothetical protein
MTDQDPAALIEEEKNEICGRVRDENRMPPAPGSYRRQSGAKNDE